MYKTYKIKDVCNLVKGQYSSTKTNAGEYPLVLTAAYRKTANSYQFDEPAVCIPLISSTGHGDAAMHRVHYEEGKFAVADLLVALLPLDHAICYPKYLYHLLNTKKDEYFVPLMAGTANVALKIPSIAEVEIPLPPIEEQRRIVAYIENLAAQIEEARGLRKGAIEEAEALLKSHLNILFGDPYNHEVGELDIRKVVTLDNVVTDVADGPHVTPSYIEKGVPFVTVKNITTGKIDFSDLKFISEEDHRLFQKRAKAEKGDVLISKDGTIGIPCYIDTDKQFSFFVSVALIKPDRNILDGRYLSWVIKTPYLQQKIKERSRGDMIKHLVLREIRALTIPLPSLDKQNAIIEQLDKLQSEIDNLKQLQLESAKELDALLPSIMDKAFKGEL